MCGRAVGSCAERTAERCQATYLGCGAAFGGVSEDTVEALDEHEGALAADGAGDWDRSITVAEASSESDDRPMVGLGVDSTDRDFEAEGVKATDNELILFALRSAIFRLIRSRNGSWCGGGSELAASLSAAACQISARRESTLHQYFAALLGFLRKGLSNQDLILFG